MNKTNKYSRFRRIYTRARWDAARSGKEFTVSLESLYRKWLSQNGRCALTGEELYLGKNTEEQEHGKNTASLDRKDSTKGYVPGNIQWVKKEINFFKRDWPEEDFIDMCHRV